ncbi:hypothetical protein N2152v2_005759 [Parachlorella kessleri]
MLLFSCCQPRKRSEAAAPTAQSVGVAADLTTSRAAEQRILRPKPAVGDAVAALSKVPSRSLLEASARRLAQSDTMQHSSQAAEAGDTRDVPMRFLGLYMAAVRDGNAKWTADSEVSNLFEEQVKMVTQDKQTFHGKQAVLRRLDKGVDMLIKMAGKDAEVPTYEVVGPTLGPSGASQIDLTIRRGKNTLRLRLEFMLSGGRIVHLRNTRV